MRSREARYCHARRVYARHHCPARTLPLLSAHQLAHGPASAIVVPHLQYLGMSSPYFWRTFFPPPTVKRKPIILVAGIGSLKAAVKRSAICACAPIPAA